MTKEDKWVRQWKSRMDSHQEPLPDDLWNRIEKELSDSRVIPMWRTRRFAVAAAIAVLLVSSVSLWFLKSPQSEYLRNEHSMVQRLEEEEIPAGQEETAHAPVKQKAVAMASVPSRKAVEQPLLREECVAQTAAQRPLPASVEAETEVAETEAVGRPAEDDRHELSRKRMKADRKVMEQNREQAERRRNKERSSSCLLGVAAGNTPYASSGTAGTGGLTSRSLLSNGMMADGMASGQESVQSYIGQETQADVHHKMPVGVGVSFAYGIGDKWALETGLYYTYLSSELDLKNAAQEKVQQKLHYLGVPLKVDRLLWQNRWLSVYTSAGVMVEKCIKGTQNITSVNDRYRELMQGGTVFSAITGLPNALPARNINEDGLQMSDVENEQTEHVSVTTRPWQLSALWSAGAQVRLTRCLGLYVEPGVAYYFDDKSELYTIRKEHPFQFTVQLGVRFRLPK